MFRILLICLGGIVQGDVRIDMGDIPYEHHDRDSAVLASTADHDYGDIPYDKVPVLRPVSRPESWHLSNPSYNRYKGIDIEKHRDYGNIPYERVFSKSHIEEYGNIPYEKDLDIPAGGGEFDIKGKIMEILGGREIPGVIKITSSYSQDHRATTPTRSILLTKPSLSKEPVTIRMRANTDAQTAEYEAPKTIVDWDCSDTPQKKCSHCYDTKGYRIYCLNGTTTAAPSDMSLLINVLVNLTKDYEDYNSPKTLDFKAFNKSIMIKYPSGWPDCPVTTISTSTPTTPIGDDPRNGFTITKCYVCGLDTEGIPEDNTLCADSFMSHTFRKHCKFLDRDGWFYNGTQDFYMWGRWSGGCSLRYVDISPVYTQRSCRDREHPATGSSYVSRRLMRLEYALRKDNDSCISTPEASLVPLSRGISLYSRMTVCVCSTNYCNRAERSEAVSIWHTMIAVGVLGIFEAF